MLKKKFRKPREKALPALLLIYLLGVLTVFTAVTSVSRAYVHAEPTEEAEEDAEGEEAASEEEEEEASVVTRDDINAWRLSLPVSTNEIPGWAQGPAVASECAVLMDADSGAILYAKNMDLEKFPASTTKVMTCLLAAEKCSMDEMITFSTEAVFGIERGSSNCGMDVGQSITVEEALYCVMLYSANEVAAALAEHISGSIEEFAHLMNERALELGCTHTHFTNPHGLPDDEHMTTAHDLALIARAFNANETLRKIASSKEYTVYATATQPDTFTMYNHHKMFPGFTYSYDFFTWGKTGYTNLARSTLVSAARKGSTNLICVVMKAENPNHYTDTRALFDYGFESFQKLNIAENETRYNLNHSDFFDSDSGIFGDTRSLLVLDESGYCILPKTAEFSDLTPSVSYDDTDPDTVARVTYTFGGNYVGETRVVLSDSQIHTFRFGVPLSETAVSSEGGGADGGSGGAENKAKGFSDPDVIFLNTHQVLITGGIVLGLLLLLCLIFVLVRNYRFSNRRREKLKKKSRHYFSEFDDFDF